LGARRGHTQAELRGHVLATDLHQGLKSADDQGQRILQIALARHRLDTTQGAPDAIGQRRSVPVAPGQHCELAGLVDVKPPGLLRMGVAGSLSATSSPAAAATKSRLFHGCRNIRGREGSERATTVATPSWARAPDAAPRNTLPTTALRRVFARCLATARRARECRARVRNCVWMELFNHVLTG
jgi:hypothetical protein